MTTRWRCSLGAEGERSSLGARLVLESLEGSVAELLAREQLQGCMAREELQLCACSQIVKDVRPLLEIGFCSV